MLGFHPHFANRHYQDVTVVSYTLRPHFTPKEIPRYSFLLQAEWTPGLLKVDRRNRSIVNFKRPYRESNPEPLSSYAMSQPPASSLVIRHG